MAGQRYPVPLAGLEDPLLDRPQPGLQLGQERVTDQDQGALYLASSLPAVSVRGMPAAAALVSGVLAGWVALGCLVV